MNDKPKIVFEFDNEEDRNVFDRWLFKLRTNWRGELLTPCKGAITSYFLPERDKVVK